MIAPCDDWLAIRSPYYAEAQTMDFSNLEYALLTPPYENTDFAEIELTREFIERREEIVQVMERRDQAEMSEIIGRIYEGLEYYDHLKREEQFLCMLYVRQRQLTGGSFGRVFRSPASLGITPEIAEALRRQPSYP